MFCYKGGKIQNSLEILTCSNFLNNDSSRGNSLNLCSRSRIFFSCLNFVPPCCCVVSIFYITFFTFCSQFSAEGGENNYKRQEKKILDREERFRELPLGDIYLNICENQREGSCLTHPQEGVNMMDLLHKAYSRQIIMVPICIF